MGSMDHTADVIPESIIIIITVITESTNWHLNNNMVP